MKFLILLTPHHIFQTKYRESGIPYPWWRNSKTRDLLPRKTNPRDSSYVPCCGIITKSYFEMWSELGVVPSHFFRSGSSPISSGDLLSNCFRKWPWFLDLFHNQDVDLPGCARRANFTNWTNMVEIYPYLIEWRKCCVPHMVILDRLRFKPSTSSPTIQHVCALHHNHSYSVETIPFPILIYRRRSQKNCFTRWNSAILSIFRSSSGFCPPV